MNECKPKTLVVDDRRENLVAMKRILSEVASERIKHGANMTMDM